MTRVVVAPPAGRSGPPDLRAGGHQTGGGPTVNPTEARALAERIRQSVHTAVVGRNQAVETTLTGLVADGHLLIEDLPGLGKTLMARSFALALGLGFQRIQFTADLLPHDITGGEILDTAKATFTFRPGPLFTNVLLADEINRAPPKVQSALLEAMQEYQVTSERTTVPRPGDGEPARARRDVPPPRGSGRPLPAPPKGRLPGSRRGARDPGTTSRPHRRPCRRPPGRRRGDVPGPPAHGRVRRD